MAAGRIRYILVVCMMDYVYNEVLCKIYSIKVVDEVGALCMGAIMLFSGPQGLLYMKMNVCVCQLIENMMKNIMKLITGDALQGA